jgi:hypothetical protein
MKPNDQPHLYFNLDLTTFLIKPRNRKSPIRGANKRNPDVVELQGHLDVAPATIGTLRGENLAFLDSVPILTSALAFLANSRSPPLSNSLLFPA